MNIVNEETIVPEKAEDDAPVVDEVEEVEAVEVDAEPVETTDTESDEVTAETEAEESSPSKENVPKERIDEVTRLRRQAERAQHEAERERDYYKAQIQQQQGEPKTVEPGKTLADFEYDEGKFTEYLHDLASADARTESEKVVQREREARLQAEYQEREAEFSETVDDFHTAVYSDSLNISPAMAAATQAAEKGPQLRYYLAKNPEVAAKLSKMAPFDMAMELGQIQATKLVKAKPPSVTTAPKPVPKIEGTESRSPIRIDDPKISDAQFRKLREKQIANR